MNIGIVSDDPDIIPFACDNSASFVVLCQLLGDARGCVTPSMGFLTRVCAQAKRDFRASKVQIYSVVRPTNSGFCYRAEGIKSVLLNDVAAVATIEGTNGVLVGCELEDGVFDTALGRQICACAGHLEVWYHRGVVLLNKETELEKVKKAGFTGMVVPLIGKTLNMRLEYARGWILAASAVGLQVMLTGDVVDRDQVRLLRSFISGGQCREVVKGWCVSKPLEDRDEPLMAWRRWEVINYLWPRTIGAATKCQLYITEDVKEDATVSTETSP